MLWESREPRESAEPGELFTKYGSTLFIGMNDVLAHYACTFKNSNLHFHIQ